MGMPNECTRGNVSRWEHDGTTPQPHYLAILENVLSQPAASLGFHGIDGDEITPGLLGSASFPASVLSGAWVTTYDFPHAGATMYHADVAHVVTDDRGIHASNHPARTEGRAVPFTNEIDARLVGRHVTGEWRNTSDTRYFGLVHLAVLPGESVMEGYYTGLASDIGVSFGRWRWVRLAGDSVPGTLREPRALYDLLMARDPNAGPMTPADVED
jgi:hypothetical protein